MPPKDPHSRPPQNITRTPQTSSAPSQTPLATSPTRGPSQTDENTPNSHSTHAQASRSPSYMKKITRNLKKTFTINKSKKTQNAAPENEIDWYHQGVEVTKEDFIGLPSISAALKLYRMASPASLARVSREIDDDFERAYQKSVATSGQKVSSEGA